MSKKSLNLNEFLTLITSELSALSDRSICEVLSKSPTRKTIREIESLLYKVFDTSLIIKSSYLENKPNRIDFIKSFNEVADEIHQTAIDKGWWNEERNDGEIIALMHSELSEALEALRHGNPPDDKIPEFTGVEAELADVIIRIMDMGPARKWRIAEAIIAKIEFNKTRKYKHGNKKF